MDKDRADAPLGFKGLHNSLRFRTRLQLNSLYEQLEHSYIVVPSTLYRHPPCLLDLQTPRDTSTRNDDPCPSSPLASPRFHRFTTSPGAARKLLFRITKRNTNAPSRYRTRTTTPARIKDINRCRTNCTASLSWVIKSTSTSTTKRRKRAETERRTSRGSSAGDRSKRLHWRRTHQNSPG